MAINLDTVRKAIQVVRVVARVAGIVQEAASIIEDHVIGPPEDEDDDEDDESLADSHLALG